MTRCADCGSEDCPNPEIQMCRSCIGKAISFMGKEPNPRQDYAKLKRYWINQERQRIVGIIRNNRFLFNSDLEWENLLKEISGETK